jgi:hypothetical protein
MFFSSEQSLACESWQIIAPLHAAGNTSLVIFCGA